MNRNRSTITFAALAAILLSGMVARAVPQSPQSTSAPSALAATTATRRSNSDRAAPSRTWIVR